MLVHAPAKLNLGLYLGKPREDGLHELCSLFEPLALADLLRITEAERDEVVCPGVEGENLAARARFVSAAGTPRRCGSRSRSAPR
jgi:4-diphosphocytidyl-2-C-methyl-D-erythritol kinase